MDVYDAFKRFKQRMGFVGEEPPPRAVPTHRLRAIDRHMVKNRLCEDPPEVEFSRKVSCPSGVVSLGEWKRTHVESRPKDFEIWENWHQELLLKRKEWKTLHLSKKGPST